MEYSTRQTAVAPSFTDIYLLCGWALNRIPLWVLIRITDYPCTYCCIAQEKFAELDKARKAEAAKQEKKSKTSRQEVQLLV